MSRYTVTFEVTRAHRELDVVATGSVERSSRACGWECEIEQTLDASSNPIELTADETDRAEQMLADAWAEDDSDACAAEMRAERCL